MSQGVLDQPQTAAVTSSTLRSQAFGYTWHREPTSAVIERISNLTLTISRGQRVRVLSERRQGTSQDMDPGDLGVVESIFPPQRPDDMVLMVCRHGSSNSGGHFFKLTQVIPADN